MGAKQGQGQGGQRIGHSGILWQQFSAGRVCRKNFSYVNNSMRDGQGKRCQRAANY